MSKKLLLLLLLALLAPWAAMAQNQLNEGFEGTAFPPDDWTTIHVSGSQAWTRSTGTGNNSSSAFALRKDVSGGYEDYLITPKLVPATGEELSFYLASQYSANYAGTTLTIEVSTTTPEIASFTDVIATYNSGGSGNFGTSGSSDWVNKTVNVSAYVGQQIYIAFHAKDTGYNADVRIDDVTGVSLFVPACPKPTNLTVDATAELATLSWTSDADSWNLKYKAADDADYTEVTGLTTTSYEMSVTPQTTYQWMVQAVCDGTPGDYTNPASFTTPCAALDIPYTYGFEEADPFECWAVISGNVSVINNASNSHESSYYLDFRGSTSNMVALPGFNAATNTLRVEFWTRPESTGGSSGKFAVGYMTNRTDASTFVAVETYNSTEMTTTYVKKAVNLNSVPANAYIAFRQFDCQTYYYWYVDDVTVMEVPSCLAPTGLAANASTNSAELSWTANSSETDWTLYYKKAADETYTEVANATNPYTLNELTSGTNYQYYVVANCSANDASEPSEVFRFATECAVIPAVGYAENFDSYTASSGFLPNCWSRINTGTSYTTYPYVYGYNSNSTPNCLYFYTYGSETSTNISDQYAILPQMEGLNGQQITLFAKGYNANSTFKIGVMEDPADVSTFSEIATQALTTSYQEFIYQVTGRGEYIAIMMPKPTGTSGAYYGVYIDNISIAEPPACPKPMSLAVVNNSITGHGATLSWESEAEAWEVAYKTATDADFTIIPNVTENPYAITGLVPETAYTVKVRANCGNGVYSEWSTATSFTTAVACTAPTGLAATLTPGNGNVATLSWTSDASAWVIAYKTADETDFTEIAVTENPYTFDRLEAETTYTAKVKANCGDEDGESQWSSTITFTPTDSYFLTVNDGTTTNQYVPFYGWMADSGTDGLFIIPATSLTALQWGTINKLTFYVSSPASATFTNTSGVESEYAVYMMETTQTAFENTTISFEGMTLVKNSFHITISDYKLEVTLDNPFDYMGGNLMIGFDETVSGGYSRTYWYGVEATGASIGGYGTSYSQQNFLPKTTFAYTPGEEPTCFKPTDFAVSNIGGHSAQLSWTSDATRWQIQVNDEDPINVAENPYTLPGLTPETEYSVKVRANCGEDGFSNWSDALTFTTDVACPAPTVTVEAEAETATVTMTSEAETFNLRYRTPRGFHYNFEQAEAWTITDFSPCSVYDGDNLPTYGITNYDFTNSGYVGSVIAFSDNDRWAAHSGNTMGVFMDAIPGDEPSNDDYFITPELTIAAGDHFIFWARSVTDSYGLERMKVGIYGGNGTFTEYLAGSATEYIEVPVAWTKYDYDLTAYDGQTIQLAINCVSNDAFALFIDDLFVGNPEDDTWDYTYTNVASPYRIADLEAETEYELQVQAVCGGDDGTSEWTSVTFTTLPLCLVPTNLAVDNITTESAKVTWESDASLFDIEINGEVTEDVSEPAYILDNLDPGTAYTIRVRAKCDATAISNWTSAVTFRTLCLSFDLPYEYGFNNDDIYCWTMESANSSNMFGILNATSNNIETVDGDDYVFLFSSYNSADDYDQILISPELNTEEAVKVEFYYRTLSGSGSGETFVVGYSTTTNDFDAFTWGDEISTLTTDWTLFRERFPAGTKYVAVYYYSDYQYYLLVDAFRFSEALPFQTIELTEGWNRISTYIAVDPDDMDAPIAMLDMFKEGLGENGMVIEGPTGEYTEFDGEEWFGDLDEMGMYNEYMYLVLVSSDCTVELEGSLVNTEDIEILIEPGWNRIGFPSTEEADLFDALADFESEEGDIIEGPNGEYTEFDGEEWFGDVETLLPGGGYMYFNNSDETKVLMFVTGGMSISRHANSTFGKPNMQRILPRVIGPSKSIDGNTTKK